MISISKVFPGGVLESVPEEIEKKKKVVLATFESRNVLENCIETVSTFLKTGLKRDLSTLGQIAVYDAQNP